eukprot:319471_1
MSLSSSETEGAENTDDELSTTDMDSSSNECNNIEENPLQQDVHQQNLIAIHMTDKRKKGEGERNGLRYMIVHDAEHYEYDDYEDEMSDDGLLKPKPTQEFIFKVDSRHKMAMFELPNYIGNDTVMVIAYLASAMFMFSLVVMIPVLNQIVTPITMILLTFSVVFAIVGVFLDGKYFLNFNYDTKEIYVQQQMCVGNCICGNKGAQGKLLGTFESFASVHKIKLNDVIGENDLERWQFAMLFKDFDGEDCNVLFTTSNEEMIDTLERNVNEWWSEYSEKNSKDGNNKQ